MIIVLSSTRRRLQLLSISDPGPKSSCERRTTMISPTLGKFLSVAYLWLTRTWDDNADDMLEVGDRVSSLSHVTNRAYLIS